MSTCTNLCACVYPGIVAYIVSFLRHCEVATALFQSQEVYRMQRRVPNAMTCTRTGRDRHSYIGIQGSLSDFTLSTAERALYRCFVIYQHRDLGSRFPIVAGSPMWPGLYTCVVTWDHVIILYGKSKANKCFLTFPGNIFGAPPKHVDGARPGDTAGGQARGELGQSRPRSELSHPVAPEAKCWTRGRFLWTCPTARRLPSPLRTGASRRRPGGLAATGRATAPRDHSGLVLCQCWECAALAAGTSIAGRWNT
jgi:hypothetical protein